MRMYSPNEETERLDFAYKAAKCFEESPEVRTFTDSGKIEQGELFAVRWGLDADCVVVLKVDEYFEPTNYQNIVDNMKAKEHTRLIAAAPKLLNVCKAVKKLLQNYRALETQFEEETINELEEAIGQAEGK